MLYFCVFKNIFDKISGETIGVFTQNTATYFARKVFKKKCAIFSNKLAEIAENDHNMTSYDHNIDLPGAKVSDLGPD
jgi:hypothetical protein